MSRILTSRTFSRAGFLRTFLELCVSETLQGNGGYIKEIWLGGEVFGRRVDFNPSIDPIVRVQARRLRQKLTLFYQTEGIVDPVRITLPVGSYVPIFSTTNHGQSTMFIGHHEISIAVLTFKSLEDSSSCVQMASTITSEFSEALAELYPLKVVSRAPDANFVIAGTVRSAVSSHQVCMELTDTRTGNRCWHAWFEQKNTRFFPDLQRAAQILKEELCERRESYPAVFGGGRSLQAHAYSMSANPRFI